VENLVGRADFVIGSWDFPKAFREAVWDWPDGLRLSRFFSAIH
jgi:signal peptidase I